VSSELSPTSFLLCRSKGYTCALPLPYVRETMRALPRQPVPDMPPFILGVSIIRGQVVPVLDLACLLGCAGADPGTRYVTLDLGARQVALAVDTVVGVRALAADALAEVPPLLQASEAGTVAALSTLDAQLLVVLQGTHLVPEALWPALLVQDAAA
jgi:purine-binding chemotaxis protein CheW